MHDAIRWFKCQLKPPKNNNQIYLQKKNNKIKTSIFFPSHLSSLDLVHVTFPEMEIKKLEQFLGGLSLHLNRLIASCMAN